MSWFNKFEEGSRTILLVAQSSASMRRRFALGAVGLVAVLGVGGYFLFQHSAAQTQEQIANAWGSLDHCLLGEPLAEGEKPSKRFRAVQLTAISQSLEPGKENALWPARCAPHAHALRDGLKAASHSPTGEKDLAFWAEKLAGALTATGAVSSDLSETLDAMWDQAAKQGMQRDKGQPAGPEPPAPATVPSVDELASAKPIMKKASALDSVQTDLHPGPALHLLVEDAKKEETLSCTLGPDDKAMRCFPIPQAIPASQVGLRLLGTCEDDADPLVFSGSRGSEGVYRLGTGDKIAATTSVGGYAAKDFSVVLGYDEGAKRISLIRKTGGDEPRSVQVRLEDKLKIAQPMRDVQVLWDHVLFRGANRFDETWLAAARIRSDAAGTDTPTDVGMLPESGANRPPAETDVPIAGCRTDKSRVVRVRGDSHDFITFFVGDRWTKPVKTSKIGGDLSCRRVEAWLTRFDSPPGAGMLESSIVAERCTPAACKTSELQLEEMLRGTLALAPVTPPMIAQLDGKILVVWMAGERGGLRMRLAPLEDLGKATDKVLFDDLVQDGQVQKTSTLADVRLFARESFAVLLIRTSEALYAMRIDSNGEVQTLAIDS